MKDANHTLAALDADLAAAIATGDDSAVHAVADQFESYGLANLAAVLRQKGAAGARETLEFFGA